MVKLTPAGNAAVSLTLLGGAGSDNVSALATDGAGNLYAAGYTLSPTFPGVNGAQWINAGNYGAFIVKIGTAASSVTVSVTPRTATVNPAQTLQFTATVTNTANTAVTWSVSPPVGTISATGLYMAPPTLAAEQTVTVKATSLADPAKWQAATVTVTPPIAVAVSPAEVTLCESGTAAFSASLSDGSRPAFVWSISPVIGSIGSNGVYTAPASATAGSVTVTASLASNPQVFGTAKITLLTGSTIWPSTATPAEAWHADSNPITVGVKFRSDSAGSITALRFYKGPGNNGSHIALLYSASGVILAQVPFSSESSSGWQQVPLPTPLSIAPNTTYVAALYSTSGFAYSSNYFTSAGVDNGPLHALRSGVDGANGVYVYSASPTFPSQSYGNANYWVDVVFR